MKKFCINIFFLFVLIAAISVSCSLINNREKKMASGPVPFLLKDILLASDSRHIISSIEEWNDQREKIKSLILSYLGKFPKLKVPLDVKFFDEKNKKKLHYQENFICNTAR